MHFLRRRLLGICLTGLLVGGSYAWMRWQELQLASADFHTGYILFAICCFLAAYNVRKKIPALPLGKSSTWLQLHIYAGLATAPIFCFHIGWRVPDGVLETLLTGIFAFTFFSGLIGIYLTRTIPARLSRVGEEVVYERIPRLRRQLSNQAQAIVLRSTADTGLTVMADLYIDRLYEFFEHPRGWSYYIRPTSRKRKELLGQLEQLRRHLASEERDRLERLFELVRKKDDLDFHAAQQGILKGWLFVHISATYSLLLLGGLHAIIAHTFWGGSL